MATLPKNVMSIERLLEKARKEIGESTEWLEDSDDNRLTPRDIWARMLRGLSGLDDYKRRLLELEGRGPTAIVTSGLPNANAIHKLFTAYAIGSTGIGSTNHLMQLADGGTLKLASLARKLVTWHFGIEDLVLVALDIEFSGRSPAVGQPLREPADLQLYLGKRFYEPEQDIHLLECSCTAEVRR